MKAILLAGMVFGDESKGQTTASLCGKFPVDQIVRYNGGPQTQHNYVGNDGIHHTFSQFGSGSIINPSVKTHLSEHMLIEPFAMMREADALNKITSNIWDRTTINPKSVVITPMHVFLNKAQEDARGANRHGSCGRGVGVARKMHLEYGDKVLLAEDLYDYAKTKEKLYFIQEAVEKELEANWGIPVEALASQYMKFPGTIEEFKPSGYMLFEGAQGVLLDETHGFAPHNTWTDTTFNNAYKMLTGVPDSDIIKIGCFRSYFTRHGYGPFPSEDPSMLETHPEPHNGTGKYQGDFRVGSFDFDLARKAVNIVKGLDFLSISHLDYIQKIEREVNTERIAKGIGYVLDTKVGIKAYSPKASDRVFSEELIERLK